MAKVKPQKPHKLELVHDYWTSMLHKNVLYGTTISLIMKSRPLIMSALRLPQRGQ